MGKKWLVGLCIALVALAIGALAWLASNTQANPPATTASEIAERSTDTQVVLQPTMIVLSPTNMPELQETRPVSPPTAIATPSQTVEPTVTSTATFPATLASASTSTATALPIISMTPTPACIDQAVDLTAATDIYLQPGENYLHSWVLQNNGTCTWTPDYSISWFAGDPLGNTLAAYLDRDVAPGDIVEVPVQMVAPLSPGLYPSQWQWVDAAGNQIMVAPGVVEPPLMVTFHVPALPTPTSTPAYGTIGGRLSLNGAPAPLGVILTLEDLAYNPIASLSVGEDGIYRFDGVPASSQGYNLVFSQAANPQLSVDQVLSWGWVGPIPLVAGEVLQLPDFEVALQGFSQISPEPDASIPVTSISPGTPLSFAWNGHPLATAYWVDLYRGEEQDLVWKSALVSDLWVLFDGVLTDGAPIQPGEYWWGVGARGALGPYLITIYGYLSAFGIEP